MWDTQWTSLLCSVNKRCKYSSGSVTSETVIFGGSIFYFFYFSPSIKPILRVLKAQLGLSYACSFSFVYASPLHGRSGNSSRQFLWHLAYRKTNRTQLLLCGRQLHYAVVCEFIKHIFIRLNAQLSNFEWSDLIDMSVNLCVSVCLFVSSHQRWWVYCRVPGGSAALSLRSCRWAFLSFSPKVLLFFFADLYNYRLPAIDLFRDQRQTTGAQILP